MIEDPSLVCGDRRGTHAGYQRHHAARDEPCDECRAGHNDYTADRYRVRLTPGRRGANVLSLPAVIGGELPTFDGAVCAQVDRELFFPEREDSLDALAAKRVCTVCPARFECLQYAIRNYEVGIWGGTSTAERSRLRRKGVA